MPDLTCFVFTGAWNINYSCIRDNPFVGSSRGLIILALAVLYDLFSQNEDDCLLVSPEWHYTDHLLWSVLSPTVPRTFLSCLFLSLSFVHAVSQPGTPYFFVSPPGCKKCQEFISRDLVSSLPAV